MDGYIYVGSYEKRWKYFNWELQLKTESSWVLVNYNIKYDIILEEQVMFDEKSGESFISTKEIIITNFEKQVEISYPDFVVNNIKLLRPNSYDS